MLRSHADHDLLTGPPPHVQAEVDLAWERAQDRFAGELRTPAGEVWERISAAEALAIACGDIAVIPAGAPRAADAVAA